MEFFTTSIRFGLQQQQQLTSQPMLEGHKACVFNQLEACNNVLACMHVVS